MPKAFTIFGIAKPGEPAHFCYGQVRTIRGSGAFPEPSVSKVEPAANVRLRLLEGSRLQLTAWDKVFDEATWGTFSSNFNEGKITIPVECPVEPGRVLGGLIYGPLLVNEERYRLDFDGAGNLNLKGVAVSDEPDGLLRDLEVKVGKRNLAVAMVELLEVLAVENNLEGYFRERRRIAVVEHIFRLQDSSDEKAMEVRTEKPDLRSKLPVQHLKIHRKDLAINSRLWVRATVRNFGEVLHDRLVEMSPETLTVSIEAQNHITEVEAAVYDEHGDRIDFLSVFFLQGFQFGLAVRGAVDKLPPPVSAAGGSPDLESRPRLQTSTFSGPGVGNRSGTMDQLRSNKAKIDLLTGPRNWRGECHWFEAGLEAQLEVIRWIKCKLEQPTVAKAYFLDPYLGTEALKRVILRNGNENIDLTILLSPGRVDPDAETSDTLATDDYVARLVTTANEVQASLCGKIKLIHVRRGDGGRQAFHDRYLVLLDLQGAPQVFLFSNSLSKAAGDWPFAISELDRPTSWNILEYVKDLLCEKDGSRTLTALNIWERAPVQRTSGTADQPIQNLSGGERAGANFMNRLLTGLGQPAGTLALNASREFISATSAGFTAEQGTKLATALFGLVGHLPDLTMHLSTALAEGIDAHHAIASRIDRLQRDQFLEALSDSNGDFIRPLDDREVFLKRLGLLLSQDSQPTNTIRNKLNPAMQQFIQGLERQRHTAHVWRQVGGAAYTITVAFHTILASTLAPIEHRVGAAIDYVHWFGRLLRTKTLNDMLEDSGGNIVDDLNFAVNAVLDCRAILGAGLAESVQRIIDDPFISVTLKTRLRAFES